jgi:hypothetical protein
MRCVWICSRAMKLDAERKYRMGDDIMRTERENIYLWAINYCLEIP